MRTFAVPQTGHHPASAYTAPAFPIPDLLAEREPPYALRRPRIHRKALRQGGVKFPGERNGHLIVDLKLHGHHRRIPWRIRLVATLAKGSVGELSALHSSSARPAAARDDRAEAR